MIQINSQELKILKARKEHKNKLIDLLYVRIDKLSDLYSIRLFDNIIINDLELILEGKPNELVKLSKNINDFVGQNQTLINSIKNVFNYKWFIDKVEKRYSGYDLAKSLDISTCVYCNRNYTTTVFTKEGKKLIRPQFDHYGSIS